MEYVTPDMKIVYFDLDAAIIDPSSTTSTEEEIIGGGVD